MNRADRRRIPAYPKWTIRGERIGLTVTVDGEERTLDGEWALICARHHNQILRAVVKHGPNFGRDAQAALADATSKRGG